MGRAGQRYQPPERAGGLQARLAVPAAIHLTAPSFQGRRQGVRIHHEELGDGERHRRDEVPVTTVERTLADITRSSDTSLLRDAVSHPSIAG